MYTADYRSGDDPFVVAGRSFRSRLMVGTGKYKDFGIMREAIAASGASATPRVHSLQELHAMRATMDAVSSVQ